VAGPAPHHRAGVLVDHRHRAFAEEVARAIMPTRPCCTRAATSPSITASTRIIACDGGRGPMRWISKPTDVAYLMRYAERLWPQIKGATWTHGWNSRLAITPDHYPHVHEPRITS
jgi:glycine/D-amino acid oxidase-like deaminating enzyme